jgi:ATP-binding protein involved in chromosome partitioning
VSEVDDLAVRVREAVGGVVDPELHRTLGDLGMIREVRIDGAAVTVGILLTIAGCPAALRIERDVHDAAAAVAGVDVASVDVGVMTEEQRTDLVARVRGGRPKANPALTEPSLTRVIAVTSGKGGVGKSTVTANLAVALAARGLAVGVIDADVHGFSIPGLLGLTDARGHVVRPTRVGELILPPTAHGVRVISIGMFLRRDGEAVPWRGPMLHHTLRQFLDDVWFGDLDVLLIDMPPGTGDAAISIGQLLPHAEVLVVTTPQPAAAAVAVRSGLVARQLGQRVVGVVETMGPATLPDGSAFEPFGAGGGAAVVSGLHLDDEPDLPVVTVPFSIDLRAGGDAGAPVVAACPDDAAAVALVAAAERLVLRPRGLAGRRLPVAAR